MDPEAQALPRDVQVNKDLEITVTFKETKPRAIREPYVKYVRSNSNSPESINIPLDNPLDDILRSSKEAIDAYILDMPYTRLYQPAEPKTPPLKKKRSHKVLETVANGKHNNVTSERNSKVRKTPVKTRQKESLQKSVLKLEHEKANEDEEANTSVQDPLACHAENIMRMAMDSTMMSSFNNSFSSTFSNIHEDSILNRKASEKENSFGISSKAAPLLNFLKSTVVEISASDLEQAVNEPFFK